MGSVDKQLKIPVHLRDSARARGLEWWFEKANRDSWCSCCMRKNVDVAHVGSTTEAANAALCVDCVAMLANIHERQDATSKSNPVRSSAGVPQTELRNETAEAAGETDVGGMMKKTLRKRSEMRKGHLCSGMYDKDPPHENARRKKDR
jgi:hypothetical protein